MPNSEANITGDGKGDTASNNCHRTNNLIETSTTINPKTPTSESNPNELGDKLKTLIACPSHDLKFMKVITLPCKS